jgi:CubicO group peptidase (beta-lactamase class C family)
VVKGGPAGGGYSTVEDLLRFAEALRSHRLLDRTHTELVLAGKVETRMGEGKYAYGFFDEVVEGERIVGHGGGFPGISSQLDIYLNSGYTVAVMSNYDGGAQLVNSRIRELLSAHR